MGRFALLLAGVTARVNVTELELLFLEGRILYVATHDLPRLKTYLI
jgi:hypothetical protein